jgi:hypothetical protein
MIAARVLSVYLLLRRLVRWIAGSSNDELSTEVELLVLRHQLNVLKRLVGRPQCSPSRPPVYGRDQQGPSSCSVVLVPGQPTDSPSVAPGARGMSPPSAFRFHEAYWVSKRQVTATSSDARSSGHSRSPTTGSRRRDRPSRSCSRRSERAAG